MEEKESPALKKWWMRQNDGTEDTLISVKED